MIEWAAEAAGLITLVIIEGLVLGFFLDFFSGFLGGMSSDETLGAYALGMIISIVHTVVTGHPIV